MSEFRIAKRYAKSLLEEAKQANVLDRVVEDIRVIGSLCAESRELVNLLKSPVVSSVKKMSVLVLIFPEIHALSKSLIQLLLNNRRESYLPAIAASFTELYNDFAGITEARVMSAFPLDATSIETIRKYLATRLNKNEIKLRNIIDTKLIGGMVIRYDDKLLDMSVSKELKEIRKQLIYN